MDKNSSIKQCNKQHLPKVLGKAYILITINGARGQLITTARDAIISNATSKSFYISLTANDGQESGTVDGTATIISSSKAVMNKSANGNRCVLEFERLNNALKITEVDCIAEHDEGTNFSGTLKKQ